jgi:hypothetical protein
LEQQVESLKTLERAIQASKDNFRTSQDTDC